tara:strand:- start:2141 stop:6181 length:4041 start_codon:yes stop_codon:yes gene_type:complete
MENFALANKKVRDSFDQAANKLAKGKVEVDDLMEAFKSYSKVLNANEKAVLKAQEAEKKAQAIADKRIAQMRKNMEQSEAVRKNNLLKKKLDADLLSQQKQAIKISNSHSQALIEDKKRTEQANVANQRRVTQIRKLILNMKDAGKDTRAFALENKRLIQSAKKSQAGLEKLTRATKNYNTQLKLGWFNVRNFRNASGKMAPTLSVLRSKLLLVSFGLQVLTGNILVKAIKNTIQAASTFENLKVRLTSLYGSVQRGSKAFEVFNKVAATTPFQLQNVVDAGAKLKAFGVNAEEMIKPVSDLAAFMGVDVVEAAGAMGRAFAGGAGAADVLRERGILQLIKTTQGIDDLTKLTLPQFRQALQATLVDPVAGIEGSTTKLAKTYTGAVSNMQDSVSRASAQIGTHFNDLAIRVTNSIGRMANRMEDWARSDLQRLIEIAKETNDIELLAQLRKDLEDKKVENNLKHLRKEFLSLLGDLQKGDGGKFVNSLTESEGKLGGVWDLIRNINTSLNIRSSASQFINIENAEQAVNLQEALRTSLVKTLDARNNLMSETSSLWGTEKKSNMEKIVAYDDQVKLLRLLSIQMEKITGKTLDLASARTRAFGVSEARSIDKVIELIDYEGESVEKVVPAYVTLNELYKNTNQAQLAVIQSNINLIEGIEKEYGSTEESVRVLAMLNKQYNDLDPVERERVKRAKEQADETDRLKELNKEEIKSQKLRLDILKVSNPQMDIETQLKIEGIKARAKGIDTDKAWIADRREELILIKKLQTATEKWNDANSNADAIKEANKQEATTLSQRIEILKATKNNATLEDELNLAKIVAKQNDIEITTEWIKSKTEELKLIRKIAQAKKDDALAEANKNEIESMRLRIKLLKATVPNMTLEQEVELEAIKAREKGIKTGIFWRTQKATEILLTRQLTKDTKEYNDEVSKDASKKNIIENLKQENKLMGYKLKQGLVNNKNLTKEQMLKIEKIKANDEELTSDKDWIFFTEQKILLKIRLNELSEETKNNTKEAIALRIKENIANEEGNRILSARDSIIGTSVRSLGSVAGGALSAIGGGMSGNFKTDAFSNLADAQQASSTVVGSDGELDTKINNDFIKTFRINNNAKHENAELSAELRQAEIDATQAYYTQLGDMATTFIQQEAQKHKAGIMNEHKAEMSRLKDSLKYKRSSDAQKAKLEDEVNAKTNKKLKKQFRIEQLASIASVWMDAIKAQFKMVGKSPVSLGMPWTALINGMAIAQTGLIMAQKPPTAEKGGLVLGNRHSQGGTIIEAERGEFIMSRNAVQSAGIETMNKINQGGAGGGSNLTFNISGNVMSSDFVEGELADKIKTAIRRGADFGIN